MPEETFSILERYGEDYTKKTYYTNPAIGRDEQLKALLLLLLTPEKSAILSLSASSFSAFSISSEDAFTIKSAESNAER